MTKIFKNLHQYSVSTVTENLKKIKKVIFKKNPPRVTGSCFPGSLHLRRAGWRGGQPAAPSCSSSSLAVGAERLSCPPVCSSQWPQTPLVDPSASACESDRAPRSREGVTSAPRRKGPLGGLVNHSPHRLHLLLQETQGDFRSCKLIPWLLSRALHP